MLLKAFRKHIFSLFQIQRLTKQTKLPDISGKELPAIDVFSNAIQYMKDHLLNEIQKEKICIKPEEIRWVLTVPAIWNDRAKQFMRDAAEQVVQSHYI